MVLSAAPRAAMRMEPKTTNVSALSVTQCWPGGGQGNRCESGGSLEPVAAAPVSRAGERPMTPAAGLGL